MPMGIRMSMDVPFVLLAGGFPNSVAVTARPWAAPHGTESKLSQWQRKRSDSKPRQLSASSAFALTFLTSFRYNYA